MDDWDSIKSNVESNGNVQTVTMEELRDVQGVSKLGKHVLKSISSRLAGMGLGHIPQALPKSQHHPVRLYKRGTAVGDLIETVLTPGESKTVRVPFELPGDIAPGTYQPLALIDTGNVNNESDEDDNTVSGGASVRVCNHRIRTLEE